MHFFCITRGIKQDVDRMIKNLESLFMNWKVKDKQGVEKNMAVQCNVQPVQLWSLVFPKEHYEQMMRTLNPVDTVGFDGAPKQAPNRKFSLAMFRKMLGLKKMPKWDPKGPVWPIWTANTQILGIGVKEDYTNEYGNEAL